MSKSAFLFIFFNVIIISAVHAGSTAVSHYQDSVRWETTKVERQLNVKDAQFLSTLDSLSKYAVDSKFSEEQQISNLHGLHLFLIRVTDRSMLREGKYTDMLRFGFSVMDWRHDGVLYEQLSSYSRFAIRCASFFADDTAGMRFVAKSVEDDPSIVLINADQFTYSVFYRHMVEYAVLSDPDFAKRYFFADNAVSYYTAGSADSAVRHVYRLFSNYGTKTAAYVLYDAVEKDIITRSQADSIAKDNNLMIHLLVKLLSTTQPFGERSLMREVDFRAVEVVRASAQRPQGDVMAQFNRFNADEKLAIIVYGYRECNPRLQETYLSILRKTDMSGVSEALIKNLSKGPLPPFVKMLNKADKLGDFLAVFKAEDQHTLTKLLAVDEKREEQPELRMIPTADFLLMVSATTKEEKVTGEVKDAPPARPIKSKQASDRQDSESAEEALIKPIHMSLSDSARGILALKRNIYMALQDIPSFIQKPYAKDAMIYAASVEPDEVMQKVDMYKGKYWCKDVLEEATLNAPINARRYFGNSTHPVTVILSYSSNPIIKKLLKMSREMDYQSRPLLLFDDMAHDTLSLQTAMAISKDDSRLFGELMKIAARKNYLGRYNVENEMNYYALHFVRAINDKSSEPDSEKFGSIDNLSCDELYYLMVYGREEVFSATFAGMFARFDSKCASSHEWNAAHFTAYPHYRSFIALCATYGKLEKFLSLFTAADKQALLTAFASDLDKEQDELSEAATVAETVANTTAPDIIQTLQNRIKASYMIFDSVQDYNGMSIYGILAAMCKEKATTDKKWTTMISKKYRTGALATLTHASITDQKPFVERMYFYDDEDGRDSYQNFLRTFSGSADWHIEQNYSYVKVSSLIGEKIEIYANKADLEESGDKEISKIIADNNYAVKCVVHRGHSFYTEATLNKVPSTAKFILVGSCGGFYKINLALRKAPDAQIISTRQIGVKQINDPILFSFNEYVRQGKDINWKIFWDEMKAKLGSNSLFYDYVPPHKNLESLFVRAYYEIMGG